MRRRDAVVRAVGGQRRRHRRRHLGDDHRVRVGERGDHVVDLVALDDRPGRADAGALAAVHAVARVEPVVEAGRDPRAVAARGEVDRPHALDAVADGDAAAAEDAFVGVAPQGWGAHVDGVLTDGADVAALAHAQVAGEVGELAAAGAGARQAVLRMAGDEELEDRPPRLEHARRVRGDDHAVGGLQGATGLKPRSAGDLDHAEPTRGRRRGRPVERAQVRDLDAGPAGDLQDGLARRGLDLCAVDGDLHDGSSQATARTACLGQLSAQAPQPVQRSTTMTWGCFRLPTTAPLGQFFAHTVQPVHWSGSMS